MVLPMSENGGHHLEALLYQTNDLVKAFGVDIRQLKESTTAKLDRIDKVLRGSNGERGLLERERLNRERLERLEAMIDKLAQQPEAVQEAKWKAWERIGLTIGIIASLLMHLLGALL